MSEKKMWNKICPLKVWFTKSNQTILLTRVMHVFF
jgi:hypothetical protein